MCPPALYCCVRLCLAILYVRLPALGCCGRLCLAIFCLPALDVASSSFDFEKHKLFGVYGGVILHYFWVAFLKKAYVSCRQSAVHVKVACVNRSCSLAGDSAKSEEEELKSSQDDLLGVDRCRWDPQLCQQGAVPHAAMYLLFQMASMNMNSVLAAFVETFVPLGGAECTGRSDRDECQELRAASCCRAFCRPRFCNRGTAGLDIL